MCALKSHNGISTKSFDIVELDAHGLDEWQVQLRSAQSTPDGELLVHLSTWERKTNSRGGSFDEIEKLVKISRAKTFTWKITLKAIINRPAIGKDTVYFVRDREGPIGWNDVTFCKMNLKDGTIIYEVPLAQNLGIITFPYRNTSLTLTPDESLAIWNSDFGQVYVFSTASGQTIDTFVQSSDKSLAVSSCGNTIWDVYYGGGHTQPPSRKITYDSKTNTATAVGVYVPPRHFRKPWCFDGDRSMIGYLIHNKPIPLSHDPWALDELENTTVDPFTTIDIHAGHDAVFGYLEKCRKHEGYSDLHEWNAMGSPTDLVTVTLPPRPKKEKERRTLEVELPWKSRKEDFFGICEDYLVFHSRNDESLLLVDFWPTW